MAAVLWWLVIVLWLIPVAATNDAEVAEKTFALALSAYTLERVRACLRSWCRTIRNKQAAKQWTSGGLKGWKPPPKPLDKKRPAEDVAPASTAPHSIPKKPRLDREARHDERPFQDSWLKDPEFNGWLEVDANGYVRCSACVAEKKNTNLGIQGGKAVSDSWVRTQLTQHANGEKHKEAVRDRTEHQSAASQLRKCRLNALSKVRDVLLVVIRCVYWLCFESVAMLKLESLYQMIRNLPSFPASFKLLPMHYCNPARCREFVMALSTAIKQELWSDILASPFVSILIDDRNCSMH